MYTIHRADQLRTKLAQLLDITQACAQRSETYGAQAAQLKGQLEEETAELNKTIAEQNALSDVVESLSRDKDDATLELQEAEEEDGVLHYEIGECKVCEHGVRSAAWRVC